MKSLFASKTVWFNILALIVLVANGFGFGGYQADPALGSYALVIITVVNVVLRLVTSKAVKII